MRIIQSMKLNIILAISLLLLPNITAAFTKLTLDRRDTFDNRDSFGPYALLVINDEQIYFPLNQRCKIHPLDSIKTVHSAAVLVGPREFACVITSPNRLPSEPFSQRYDLRRPYVEAMNLVCFIPVSSGRMFSIWVRYGSGEENVLFLVAGRGFGTINFNDGFGRYITAVKVVAEPLGSFACKLETDDGDLMFSRLSPLIGVTSLSRAISCGPRI